MRSKRSKRGISTIIGAVFFMFIIIAAMTMMSWASRQQGTFSTAATEVGRQQLERAASALEITEVKISNNKFNITLQNNGPLTESVVRLWATNETVTNWHNKYDVNHIVNPKQVITNVGQSLPFTVDSLDAYKLKLVTERGAIISFRSLSVAQADLKLSMYLIPATISSGEDVTIMMSVNNNARDVDSIHKLNPAMTVTPICTSSCPTYTQKVAPTELNNLPKGSTALFKWIYFVEGPADSQVKFNGTLANAKQGNFVSDIVSIETPNQALLSVLAGGLGSVILDIDSFKYYHTNGDGLNVKGYPAFAAPSGQSIMWSLNLTNNDPQKRNITLSALSLLQTSGTQGVKQWYICDGLKNPIIPGKVQPYNTTKPKIQLNLNVTKTVYFGSASQESDGAENTPSPGMEGIFVILAGKFNDGTPYGQTIPFEATRVHPAWTTVSPTSGITGATISISGGGFKQSASVDIMWRYSDGTNSVMKTVTSTPSGTISTTFTVPSSPAGYYIITATDEINPAQLTFQHL